MNSRRILIVSQIFAPVISPRAFRWEKIAENWARRGDRVDVVTGWFPALPKEEIRAGVHVHRVGGALTERIRYRLKSNSLGECKPAGPDGEPKRFRFAAAALKRLYALTWKKIYWPDYACLWHIPGFYMARRLLAQRKYDAMISVSDPFTSHTVAFRLHKIRPGLHWMMDIGDPFSFRREQPTNNHHFYRALNLRLEEILFAAASSISVTNSASLQKYVELHSPWAGKLAVIPPLHSLAAHTGGTRSFFPKDDKIRLLYVGTLDHHIRSPENLLSIFRELLRGELKNRLELHFFGHSAGVRSMFQPYEGLINRNIFLHGLVPRKDALQVMTEATVLVNLSNLSHYQLPSKVVDYASTGKPILNLTRVRNDLSTQFFHSYPAALNILIRNSDRLEVEVERIRDFLLHLPKLSDSGVLEKFMDPFRIDSIVAAYDKLIS